MSDRIDTDAIRAEGRRLLADLASARKTIDGDRVEDAKEAWVNFTYQHHDVLLADPAPVGLTQAGYTDEAIGPNEARMIAMNERLVKERDELRAEVDRLSAAPVGPTEVAQDQVDWRVMALRVKHKSAGPECSCENPKPGAHAQSCPRFGMNP